MATMKAMVHYRKANGEWTVKIRALISALIFFLASDTRHIEIYPDGLAIAATELFSHVIAAPAIASEANIL